LLNFHKHILKSANFCFHNDVSSLADVIGVCLILVWEPEILLSVFA
jgi:hypothetical protein